MDGQEQVRPLAIGDRRSFLEGHEGIDASREHDFESVLLRQELFQPKGDIEYQVGLGESFGLGTRIVSAVSGIDHDARHPEPELPRQ